VGIPKSDIGKLFTKFFRAKNIEQYGVEGSGLGLYLTKNIINRHGGDIRVESVENRGSTFYLTLPTDSKLIPLKRLE
jgi:signal transduction histidine kinase